VQLTDWILGRRLASSDADEEKFGAFKGLPSLGLDGLSSAAYGPEAALSILIPLGVLGLSYVIPITAVILALLFILYFSYRQTISAYPNGGGSYTVAGKNLGTRFGLLAAAALMLDYTLNVAVGISAGVGAIISAIPTLHNYTLPLCLVMLGMITIINLRGAREAGGIFAVPTYAYIGTLLAVICIGVIRTLHGGHPHAIIAAPPVLAATSSVTLWLILRAFASGCTAMTGVEAVSNGVTVFAKPVVRNAHRTLTLIVVTLAVLLAGIAYLSHSYGIAAMDETRPDYQSVISLLLQAIVGRSIFYYFTLGAVLTVLVLSANTSYAGFPRLCRLMAMDDYLPHSFGILGRRLVFTVGIVFLSSLAAILLIAFNGITDRLIPLFAVGAFLAFTLSQAGMVMHWRTNDAGAKTRGALVVNGIGAVATAVALCVILVAKFAAGAWVTVVIMPVLVAIFVAVKRHYAAVVTEVSKTFPLDITHNDPPVAVVPLESWNIMSERALRFAIRLSPDVFAVHMDVSTVDEGIQDTDPVQDELAEKWKMDVIAMIDHTGVSIPHFEILQSPYRQVCQPLIEYIHQLQTKFPDRMIAVIIPELVETRWYEWMLHNHEATALKANLLLLGDPHVVVINVPWYFRNSRV
jgi:amino acid transporter